MQSLFCTALLPRPLNRLSDRPQVAARRWEEPPPPSPPRQTSVSDRVGTFRNTETNAEGSVLGAGVQRRGVALSCRQRASGEQLEKLRLSYWHAGPGTQLCPETAVKQQPIAQQSGACFLRRMLMRCNLLLSAPCGQRFPSLRHQSDSPGSSLTGQLEIHLNHTEVKTL